MRKSCVQISHNSRLSSGINSKTTHRVEYKYSVPVYKHSIYARARVQVLSFIPATSAQDLGHFYRLIRLVMPGFHRAY